jgi:hypothetical protein
MSRKNRLAPTPALWVAVAALVVAMSGAAFALPGKFSVKKDDIAKGAVTAKALAKNAVTSKSIAKNAVAGKNVKNNAITGTKVKDESLSSKDVSDYAVISSIAGNFVKLNATAGATQAAARAAAPATTLFKKGAITISAKCFRDTSSDTTTADIYVTTTVNGSLLDGSNDLGGGPAITDFLNTTTLEEDRTIDTVSSNGATANIDEGEFTVVGADGTHVLGQVTVAAKNGILAGGDGVYGPGNVCLFGGHIAG